MSISEDYGNETITEDWDKPLTDLVGANANTIVRSPWHAEAELPLGLAILDCQVKITSDNVDLFVMEVQQLLANRVAETEEFPEEEAPEKEENQKEEEPAKTEEANQNHNADANELSAPEPEESVAAAVKPLEAAPEAENVQPLAEGVITKIEPKTMSKPATETVPNVLLGSAEPKQSSPAEAEATARPVKMPLENTNQASTVTRDIPATANTYESITVEISNDEASKGLPTSGVPIARKEMNGSKHAHEPIARIKNSASTKEERLYENAVISETQEIAVDGKPLPAAELEVDLSIQPAVTELNDSPESGERLFLNLENTPVSNEAETTDGESYIEALEYRADDTELTDFVEDEFLFLKHTEADIFLEDAVEVPEPNLANDFYNMQSLEIEAAEEISVHELGDEQYFSEQPVPAGHIIGEVEEAVVHLSEGLMAGEPEIVEAANEILDRIIGVPAKIENKDGDMALAKVEAHEELKELFTELLDKMGIEHSPELIESLANLTFKQHLADELVNIKTAEGEDETQDSGTHEIIKMFLVGINNIKKGVAHACAIGRSALKLYTVRLSN